MIREQSALQHQADSDYVAAFVPLGTAGLPKFRLGRILTAAVALVALVFSPLSAEATLYVIVLDKRQIAIASDGKWLVVSGDSSRPVSQIKEKVIRLSSGLAFMCDGLTEIDTTTVKIHAADLAKQLNHEYQSQDGSNHLIAVLAGAFGQVMSDRLNQLSPEQRNQVFAIRQRLTTPGRQLLECLFAGRDPDNKLKIETVDVLADSSEDQKKYFSYQIGRASCRERV